MNKVLTVGAIVIPVVLLLGTLAFNAMSDSQTNANNVATQRDSLMDKINKDSN